MHTHARTHARTMGQQTLGLWKSMGPHNRLHTVQGIETGTLCMMQDILQETLGADREIAYLSGPSFARWVGLRFAYVYAHL